MLWRFLQQKLISAWFFLTDPRYRAITRSGIFDKEYYLAVNPDLVKGAPFPLVHYLRKGWHEGRKPNLFFDPLFYLHLYPEVAANNAEPLCHYLSEGWRKGYAPALYFSPDYYLQQPPALTAAVGNPLAHYLRQGCRVGRRPSPYFDPDYYRDRYPDIAPSGMHPLDHYLTIGALENRLPSPSFDIAWYLDRTPVLRNTATDIVAHYIQYGAGEGKSPLPLFDPQYYREQNLDVENRRDLFIHYLSVGLAEDRRPSRWFDPGFYRRLYLAVVDTDLSPLEHYLEIGVHDQCYPDSRVQELPQKPLISLVVPVYNVEEHYLNNCIRSVLYQAYPHWELCLADDCSSQPLVRETLQRWAAQDKRIKTVFLETNQGISGATNAAAALATGEYIGFLDNDDELTVECLYQVAKMIGETGADLLYTDEDLIGADGRRFSCFYKPGLNRELLLGHNYIVHLLVTRKELFDLVGGFDPVYDGAQDYDLVLKLSERARKTVHIPHILYHWRASETSTSINHGQKSYADEAGRKALVSALERRGIAAEVTGTEWKFFYQVQRKLLVQPLVSILVSWADEATGAVDWLRSLLTVTAYKRFEICVIMHRGEETAEDQNQSLSALGDNIFCLFVPENSPLAEQYTLAVRQSRGDYLVFLDPVVTVTNPDWLGILLAQAQYPETGMVSARLDSLPGEVDEIATIPDISNASPTYYLRFLQEHSIHMNGLQCSQNVWAVSRELCLVSRKLFTLCGGFDEKIFSALFWGLDFCLRLHSQMYANVYDASVIGHRTAIQQSASENDMKVWNKERALFQERWRDILRQGDPYGHLSVLDDRITIEAFRQWYTGVSNVVPSASVTAGISQGQR